MQTPYPLDEDEKNRIAGPRGANLTRIEEMYHVKIAPNGRGLVLDSATPAQIQLAARALDALRRDLEEGREPLVHTEPATTTSPSREPAAEGEEPSDAPAILLDRLAQPVRPRTPGQAAFVQCMRTADVVLASGPAGTGKTFLAVAIAVSLLEHRRIQKIVLVRPAVESGEYLGYLPGDLREKIAPYMTPLHDALHALLPKERVKALREENALEIAPLAYMRGRTLDNCFAILDEAQNTTIAQMKMFLTRIGVGSKVVVTGDNTQRDLPRNKASGLFHAIKILGSVRGIQHTELTVRDVVRHRLVKDIIQAYDKHGIRNGG